VKPYIPRRTARGRALTGACAAAVLLLAGCGRKPGSVTLGVAGPLEKANGHSMHLAAQMAADEINAAGGVNGDSLILKFQDDKADAKEAIQVAARLRADPSVVAVIGHVTSSATVDAAPIYNKTSADERASSTADSTGAAQVTGEPLVEISPASSSVEVTNAGDWTFRIVPTDLEHAPVLAQWAERLGARRAAIVYSNDDYGRGVMSSFADAFQGGGRTVVSRDPYLGPMVDNTDGLQPFLARAISRGADALVVAAPADGVLKIIRQARGLGFRGPILGGDGLTSLKDSAAANGVYVSSAFLPDRADARTQEFVKAYEARYHELPDHRGAMTYDLVYLLVEAIKKAGANRAAIRDYLAQVGSGQPAFPGKATGEIRFDKNGDVVGRQVVIGVIQNGRLVTASR
jgi:branched-chain amino acid transport system substrate-binding protein